MTSKLAYGYGHLRIGNDEIIDAPNFMMCDRALEGVYNEVVGAAAGPYNGVSGYPYACPVFARYNTAGYRYRKDSTLVLGQVGFSLKAYAPKWMNPSPVAYSDFQRQRSYVGTLTMVTTESPMAVGSISYYWGDSRYLPANVAPYMPSSYYGYPAYSFIDVPGTMIGLIYKHPVTDSVYTRSQYFNEVGIVPLSQGDVEIGGVYAPPENLLQHRMYKVYYTKSGGCGKAEDPAREGTGDGTVTVVGGDDDRFSATGLTLAALDEGKYIVVRRANEYVGTFLVKIVNVGSNYAEIDSIDINQGWVSTEGSLDWEVRTGPIGEYFF